MNAIPFFAAVLHAVAYGIYIWQIREGLSSPNAASWSIWAFLAMLNAASYWKATKSTLGALQFFVGSVACLVVWTYSVFAGKFMTPSTTEYVVLALGIAASYVWFQTKKAEVATILVGFILAYSFVPTYQGVINNPASEKPLPWLIWTGAYFLTALYAIWRSENAGGKFKQGVVATFVPIVGMLLHLGVAIIAM